MYYCDFCKRKIKKKNSIYGHVVCSKHMHQLVKYGKVLDNNPRTQHDLNAFRFLDKNTVEFDVYNQKSEKVNSFIIDSEDLSKIRYKKWRVDTNNRIITGNSSKKNPRRELSRILLDATDENLIVDYIDGNTLNNRKSNLRICTQEENMRNKSFMSRNTSDVIGVPWDKSHRKWAPEIRFDNKRYHLGRYDSFEEAVYARYVAENIGFKEFRNTNNDIKKHQMFQTISERRKKEITEYVTNKIIHKSKLSA